MAYEFSGLKTEGERTFVVFNKAGVQPLKVEASDFALTQFDGSEEIPHKARTKAAVAIIEANVDIFPPPSL